MDSSEGFFRSPPVAGLVRPLAVAALWAYAVALAGGLVVGLAALIALVVAAVAGIFNDSIAVTGAASDTVRYATWVVVPVVAGIAVWVAAYGTTRQGSLPRAAVAAPVAVVTAVALYLLGSSGFLAGGLALGWALAIPAASPSQVAARGLPLIVAALFVPGLDDLHAGVIILAMAVSPVAAAAGVFIGQLPWRLSGARSIPPPE